MNQNIVFSIYAEIGAVFIFLDLENSLIVVYLVNFEQIEELLAHFYQLLLPCIVSRKGRDGWDWWNVFVGILEGIDLFDFVFGRSSVLLGVVAVDYELLLPRIELEHF